MRKRSQKERKTYLYQYFNDKNIALYIGATCDPVRRDELHSKKSDWYHLVSSTTLEVYPNAATAMEAEISAILKGKPLFNKHAGGGGLNQDRSDTKVLSFRANVEDIAALDEAAKQLGITRTEILRRIFQKFMTNS